jgi:hypothetical protein
MKKLLTFASDIRINAMLCCGASVLLTACGGGMTDAEYRQQMQTAAAVTSSADQSAINSVTTAPNVAEADNGQQAQTAQAVTSGADQSAANIGATAPNAAEADYSQQSQTAAAVTGSADQSATNSAATTPNAADAAGVLATEAAPSN